MAATVSGFRAYLRPPPDITDEQLNMWLASAKSEARTAGVPAFEHNAQYDIFIYALATWYYDNRGMQVSGTYQATALETKKKITDAFVLQLRHATEDPLPPEPDPEPDDPPDDTPQEVSDTEEVEGE